MGKTTQSCMPLSGYFKKRIFLPSAALLLLSTQVWAETPANTDNTATYTVQERAIVNTITLGGTVIPEKEVTLSAQLPGRINVLAGEEGNRFPKDTILIAIDDTELKAKRQAAVATWMKADSALRTAGVQYQRELVSPDSLDKAPGGMGLPFLFDEMITEPMSDMMGNADPGMDRYATLQKFNSQIEQARSSLSQARFQIEAIDAKLRDSQGLAPFDGVIIEKMVEIGDTVQPGMPLLKFADISHLQIQVEVPARFISGLSEGMILNAKLDVGGWVKVRVAQIFPIADRKRHTITVKFDLPKNTTTGAGQYAQVEVHDVSSDAKKLPVIPRSALVPRGSLPSVYVVNEGKRELRVLRLGNTYGDEVTVISGLKAGEVIENQP